MAAIPQTDDGSQGPGSKHPMALRVWGFFYFIFSSRKKTSLVIPITFQR